MKLSRSDAAVSAAVLLAAAGLMYLFVTDLNAVSRGKGLRELGSVVFKKLSATRKESGGFAWERMRNNSPVYDADTLRTADFSEAALYFDDGTNLDMLENSMLKLNFGGKIRNLEFLSGEISVASSKDTASYAISSTAGTVNVDKGAKAVFSREADKLNVELSRGGASIVKADGSSRTIAQNQEVQVDMKSGEITVVSRPILPVSPERNGRLLSYAEAGKAAVEFAWRTGAAPKADRTAQAKASYVLELSRTKDFSAIDASSRTESAAARVDLGAGTWYWRVRDADGAVSPVRKFRLETAAAPSPAFPPDGRRYEYRRVKPEVRFAWSSMDAASSYLFEIASEPGFAKPVVRSRTATASLTVDSLGEGVWYWRVSPIHASTVIGAAPAVLTRSVVIAASPSMTEPALIAPFENMLFQTQDIGGKGLDLSWVPESEAVSYELVVSRKKDLSSPLLKAAAARPYLKLSGVQAAPLARPGVYYWGVRWIDKEGNASPPSAARVIQGIDGSIALRPSFPPDGYRAADSLIRNTRFAWKTNVNARTVFQLARDEAFKDIAYEETVTADTLIGRDWKSGRYWWRLRSYNGDGSVFLDTQARVFDVVEPFAGPSLVKPAPGSGFYLREHDPTTFAWTPIAGADYYNLTLRSAADNYASAVYEKAFLESSSMVYPLGDLPSGSYKLSVQAFAASGEKTTRIIGYIGDTDFRYKRLPEIKLESPAAGEHLDGLAARKGAAGFAYAIEDKPDAAEIVVSTDTAGKNVVSRAASRTGQASVGRLNPGVYYWTVKGTLAGFDVSAKESVRFEVDPPLPPPGPALSAPFDATLYLVQDLDAKGIDFSWAPESEAVSYELVVSRDRGLSSPLVKVSADRPKLTLSGPEAAALKRPGTYYWGVRWTNAENDVSYLSPSRALQGVEGADAVRLAFPPDGYRVADSLLRDIRFAWKSDLNARAVFQLARDPSFRNLAYETAADTETVVDRGCSGGRYYWRLRTRNADGSVFLDTPPRSLVVVEPFAAPTPVEPAKGGVLRLREHDSATLSWTPVEGADRYNLVLRSAADNYASVVFEKKSIDAAFLEYRLGDLPSGTYRLSLQAHVTPGEKTTRIAGRVGESEFGLRCLSYVKLESPKNGEHLPGLDARRGKTFFAYTAADAPETAEIVVSTDSEGTNVIARAAPAAARASLGRLDPGTYYWTVRGRLSGLDISAKERFRFVVDPPPPLAAAELLQPARNAVFGPAELRKERRVVFSWKSVEGATHYRLAVYPKDKKEPVFVKDKLGSTDFSIDDLSVLDKGGFNWTVEARSYDGRGEIEQPGREARSSFIIDLPAVRKAKSGGGDKLYGR